MRIIAECGDRIMAVEDGAGVNELTRCRVFNMNDGRLAPSLPIGSWTARMGPWVKPSRNYDKELTRIDRIIKSEK